MHAFRFREICKILPIIQQCNRLSLCVSSTDIILDECVLVSLGCLGYVLNFDIESIILIEIMKSIEDVLFNLFKVYDQP